MLGGAVDYLYVGNWVKRREESDLILVSDRFQVFEVAAAEIRDQEVLYLEFGVFQGESIRTWSRLLRNPNSKLHGFDSFQGLPETWNAEHERGRFSLGGAIPQIDDARVTFFKGWFEETLPRYALPTHERLFINIDSDLYSSAKTVLQFMRPFFLPGTFLYFDEFHHREHELKAFDEFLLESNIRFKMVAANRQFSSVLFRCTP